MICLIPLIVFFQSTICFFILKADLVSISGHKLYGPQGVGALYVRRRPRVRLEPIISGGGQERGLRSGTLPTALTVGLGAACAVAMEEMQVSLAFDNCAFF